MYNMTTIDQLLVKITSNTTPTIEELMPSRDSKVLRSLATVATSQKFITENQGKLIVRIIKEHTKNLLQVDSSIPNILAENRWSATFRVIDKIKKFYINTIDGQNYLDIEFSFDASIRKILTNRSSEISGIVQLHSGKLFRADCTERNIVILTELLSKNGFTIDDKITNHYTTIKSWTKEEIIDRYRITSITNSNFQKYITQDLGLETAIDQNIINDRSHRYQYFVERKQEPFKNLTEQIANRAQTKVWVDKKEFSLADTISSLVSLRRVPILFVFDGYDTKKCVEELKNLAFSLAENDLDKKVGIYFRLDNDTVGKEFNQIVSDCQFNQELNSSTEIVGVQSGKIPKFLLTTKWKPMSVVCIGNSLKQSKTAVYSYNCDLIIQYSDSKPLFETKILWE